MTDTLEAAPGLSAADTDADSAASRVSEVVQQLRADFKDRDELYHRVDKVVFGEIPVHVPKAYRKTATVTKSPLAAHIANTVTAALTVNAPHVQRTPIGFGDRFLEDATALERFHDAAWQQQEEDADRELFRLFLAAAICKGESVLKTLPRTQRAWSGYGLFQAGLAADLAQKKLSAADRDKAYDRQTEEWKQKQDSFPIGTTDVTPETFYYLKGEEGMTFACEVTQVPYLDALARHLDSRGRPRYALDGDGRIVSAAAGLPMPEWAGVMKSNRFLSCVEAYDHRYCYLFLLGPGQRNRTSSKFGTGTLVQRIPHAYGNPDTRTLRGPYFHALGITTASRLPSKAGLGIITPWLDLFPQLDALLTMYANGAYVTGWTAYKTNRPAASEPRLPESPFGNDRMADRRQRARTIEPGMVWPDDISPMEHPAMGSAFKEYLGVVRGIIDLALPAVVQGVVEGDPSGYALNQAAHLARLAWDPIVKNAEKALSRRVGFEAYLIDKVIGERVYAYGTQPGRGRSQRGERSTYLSVDPEDYGGVHKFKVRLDPELPANKMMDLRYHQTALELRVETWEQAVEAQGNNPDEVERAWQLWDLKQTPEVKGLIQKRTLQLLAIKTQQQEQEALASMQALDQASGVVVPGQGGPPGQAGGGIPGGGAMGQVQQPGFGMPETPPPPAGASAIQLRGSMGTPAGMPGGLPATHEAIPGQ